jgi:hypothetical protein
MLSSLFLSSCYWQPFPLDSPLSSPWSENVTTFAEALNASLSPLPPQYTSLPIQIPLPSVIRAVDRCWCDFSTSRFFDPFNVTEWERSSVEKLKGEVEMQRRLVLAMSEAAEEERNTQNAAFRANVNSSSSSIETTSSSERTANIMSILRSIYRSADLSQTPPPPPSRVAPADASPAPSASMTHVPSPETMQPRSLLRKEYDLREHNMDLIIDFGWSRSGSSDS